MQRVAALFLPLWPIERLWRAERRVGARPDARALPTPQAPLRKPAQHEGHWRPGARWAHGESQILPELASGRGTIRVANGGGVSSYREGDTPPSGSAIHLPCKGRMQTGPTPAKTKPGAIFACAQLYVVIPY